MTNGYNKLYYTGATFALIGFGLLCLSKKHWLEAIGATMVFIGTICLAVRKFLIERNNMPKDTGDQSINADIIEAAKWAEVDPQQLNQLLQEKLYTYKWSHGDSDSATYSASFTESGYLTFVAVSFRQNIHVKLISKEANDTPISSTETA